MCFLTPILPEIGTHLSIDSICCAETCAEEFGRLRFRLIGFFIRKFHLSSNFTLSSSTTDGSLAPSSLFNHKPREESKTSASSAQLKKHYRDISALETKILADSGEPQDESPLVIESGPSVGTEEAEMVRWKKATDDHRMYTSLFLCLTYTGS